MKVGERIKLRREELGMTQTELAEKVQSTKQSIYKYENGIISNIPSDKIETIANALGVSPAYLMGWESEPKTPANNPDFSYGVELKPITDYSHVFDTPQWILNYGGGGADVPESTVNALINAKKKYDDKLLSIKLEIVQALKERDFTEEQLTAIKDIVNSVGIKGGDS